MLNSYEVRNCLLVLYQCTKNAYEVHIQLDLFGSLLARGRRGIDFLEYFYFRPDSCKWVEFLKEIQFA